MLQCGSSNNGTRRIHWIKPCSIYFFAISPLVSQFYFYGMYLIKSISQRFFLNFIPTYISGGINYLKPAIIID